MLFERRVFMGRHDFYVALFIHLLFGDYILLFHLLVVIQNVQGVPAQMFDERQHVGRLQAEKETDIGIIVFPARIYVSLIEFLFRNSSIAVACALYHIEPEQVELERKVEGVIQIRRLFNHRAAFPIFAHKLAAVIILQALIQRLALLPDGKFAYISQPLRHIADAVVQHIEAAGEFRKFVVYYIAVGIYFAFVAEINYLFDPQMRDSYVALLDIDYISSTYTVACGNGIVYSQAFSVGIGHIAALMMDELNIPFEVATKFLSRVNLNAKEMLTSVQEIRYNNVNYSYSTATLRDIIREGLDGICQMVEECIQTFAEKDMTGRPVYVTGEGLKVIRGTAEHLSNRLVCSVEAISPRVPYYDKPRFSSLLSLLDAALGDSSNS